MIEQEINQPIEWKELEAKKASWILVSRQADIHSKHEWNTYFEWMLDNAELIYKVFGKYIREF